MPNAGKLVEAQRIFDELLCQAMRGGFYGEATIKITIQDGRLEHVTTNIEQSHRIGKGKK